MRLLIVCAALAVSTASLSAQQPNIRPPSLDSVARPAARPADVSSPDAIIKAVYEVISGPAGQKRDWDRMRSLFVPNARLMPAVGRGAGAAVVVLSVDDYIRQAGPSLERDGFFEVEIKRVAESYGNIMHLFSTYESRRKPDDAQPFARGINSFQLLKDGDRWWVVSIYWQGENQQFPIPAKYLP
jgi:hypothetical protein